MVATSQFIYKARLVQRKTPPHEENIALKKRTKDESWI